MGSKINDKSFSFLGDWSETIMRSVFIALVGVAVIALIVCIIWAKSQNMVEEDPQKRKLNNRKIFAGLIVLILVVVMWPLVELIKSNVKKPDSSGGSTSGALILNQITELYIPSFNFVRLA